MVIGQIIYILAPTLGPPGPRTTCFNLVLPSHTVIFYNGGSSGSRPVGTVALHSCDTGYNLNGGSTRTCQSDLTWSGSAPTCEGE